MNDKKTIPNSIKHLFKSSNNFSDDVKKTINKYKKEKLSVLSSIYLNIKLQLDMGMIKPDQNIVNMLTALKFIIEKKNSRRDFYRILTIAIITPIFSIVVSTIISLMIK